MGWLSGKSSKLRIVPIEDKIKTGVSNPLSEFLSRNVGKGLPGYTESTGKSLYEPLDPQAYNRYQEFISQDAGDWYDKAVYAPAMKAYKEETLPLLKEAHAGQLSSSRFDSALTESATDLSESLAQGRYQAELQVPQAQYGMASSYADRITQQKQLEYQDWMKSLPEYNPVLGQALQFLAGPSGMDYITYQTAAQTSGWEKIIGWGIQTIAALKGGGSPGATPSGTPGNVGGFRSPSTSTFGGISTGF